MTFDLIVFISRYKTRLTLLIIFLVCYRLLLGENKNPWTYFHPKEIRESANGLDSVFIRTTKGDLFSRCLLNTRMKLTTSVWMLIMLKARVRLVLISLNIGYLNCSQASNERRFVITLSLLKTHCTGRGSVLYWPAKKAP